MDLVYLLLLPFAGSLVAALMPTHARTAAATWAALVAAAGLVWVALLFPQLRAGEVLREEYRWIPSAGINFVIRMDGFAWMFAMLVTGIGTLVALYARYYMSKNDPVPRFFSFFLAFMGAMLGVVLSGNLVQIAFFWELTSLFSFLLIGYWHHRRDARRGARMALTITGAGGLALLAGMLMLGHIVGSYDLDAVLAAAGSSWDKVAKTTVFLQDLADFAAFNAVYEAHLKGAKPARSTVQVAGLPRGAKVEIELIAEI